MLRIARKLAKPEIEFALKRKAETGSLLDVKLPERRHS